MKKTGLRFIGILGLLSIMLTSQVMFSGLVNNSGNTSRTENGLDLKGISTSAANQSVQLAGAGPVVRLLSRNQTITVANTSATSNLTFSSIPATSSDLFKVNSTLRFSRTQFSTNDTIENNSGFDYPYLTSWWLNTTNAAMPTPAISLVTGNTVATYEMKYLNWGPSFSRPWAINSVSNKVRVNITYAEPQFNMSWPNAIRDEILLACSFNQTVSLDIYMFDNYNGGGWVKVTQTPIPYQSSTSHPDQIFNFIDKHSQALRSNKNISVSYVFSAGSPFQLRFYKSQVQIFQARQIPIMANNWVALSFDLRGPAIVQGFWMWIRSLDLSSHENLIMTLFKSSNSSITLSNIQKTGAAIGDGTDAFFQHPGQKILTMPTIVDYSNDSVNYFKLSSPLSLPTGNYFIVLNSNKVSGTRYSLVTIAWNDDTGGLAYQPLYISHDPLQRRYQTVAYSITNGTAWNPVKNNSLNHADSNYSREVNAGPFKIQLLRGLVPSDLNLTINGTTVKNWTMNPSLPYSASNFEWGKGYWNQTNLAIAATAGSYKLGMTWNKTIAANFIYNATAILIAYANDPTIMTLHMSTNPSLWQLNYNFNRTKYSNWAAYALNFTYPADWVMINITYPDSNNYYNSTRIWALNSYQKYYGINETMITAINPPRLQQGPYTAWFSSPNYLKSVTTYLRYNTTTYYPATQFSPGDAMCANVVVQSSSGRAVLNGHVNMSVFSPVTHLAFQASSNIINSTAGFETSYRFNDTTLHTFNITDLEGTYMARTYWFNGSEAGIAFPNIYNVNYTVIEYSGEQEPDQGVDRVYGSFTTGSNQSVPTSIVPVTLDLSKQVPLGIVVNQTFRDIYMETFNQSETVFHPGDTINFKVELKSNALVFQHSVKVQVQVFQALQPDRIIMNVSTSPFVLNYTGGINNDHTFAIDAKCPTGSAGYNAPFRHALLETRVQFIVDGNLTTTWVSNETYAVKMDSSAMEGTVLGVAINPNQTGKVFSQTFDRVNQTVFNKPTTFMLLLESSDGVTLTKNLFLNLTNTMTSKFENITVAPLTGDVFAINNRINITGNLSIENGSLFKAASNITVMKRVGLAWLPYNSIASTNVLPVVNGAFNGIFLLPSIYSKTFNVSLNCSGFSPTINKTSTIIVINMTNYSVQCKIISYASSIDVYGGVKNFYTFRVQNTGNTTLMFDSNLTISGVLSRNATWINNGLLNMAPNSTFDFTVVLLTTDPGFGKNPAFNITIILHAYSIETKNPVTITQTFLAFQRSVDIATRLGTIWYVGYFAILAILILLALVLVFQVIRQSRMPAGPGALARGKMAGKEGEKPYIVKKGAELGKEKSAKEKGTEKKYRPIEEAMKEMKGDSGSKANVPSEDKEVGKAGEKATEDEDSEA